MSVSEPFVAIESCLACAADFEDCIKARQQLANARQLVYACIVPLEVLGGQIAVGKADYLAPELQEAIIQAVEALRACLPPKG